MRGHELIIAMRRAGKVPLIVFINEFPCATDWPEFNDHATIQILRHEPIETLDLRFLVGLTVSVAGSTEKRATRLFEACKLAGARTVAACGPTAPTDHYAEHTWGEIWQKS